MSITPIERQTTLPVIVKSREQSTVTPNLIDYNQVYATFSWDEVAAKLDGLPNGAGVNIAYEAVGRHAAGPRRHHLALRWLGKHGERRDFDYAELDRLSNRFANVLQALGVDTGERVFTLMGRVPEIYLTALGTLKRGAVFCPLFSAFGPEPIRQRLSRGEGSVLVTTEALYRKIAGIRSDLPTTSRFRRPHPRRWRCCTSRAARPACRREPSMSTARS
jgi:acetyl-CoA synthetase